MISKLNNNLAELKQNYILTHRGNAYSQEELDVIINDTASYKANSIYEYTVTVGVHGLSLPGGTHVIRGYKYNVADTHGWQEARSYIANVIRYRIKQSGVWDDWVLK